MARDFDVLLESFRPGVMDRLGVGYEQLRKQNEGLVFCAISGYGAEHPEYARRVGHDLNYMALVGVLGLSGERGDRRSRRRCRWQTPRGGRCSRR